MNPNNCLCYSVIDGGLVLHAALAEESTHEDVLNFVAMARILSENNPAILDGIKNVINMLPKKFHETIITGLNIKKTRPGPAISPFDAMKL